MASLKLVRCCEAKDVVSELDKAYTVTGKLVASTRRFTSSCREAGRRRAPERGP